MTCAYPSGTNEMGIFEQRSRIFKDATVLDDEYQPDELLERDEELDAYRQALQPVVDSQPLNNIFLYGKTGTGKSVATQYMLDHLEEDAEQFDDVPAVNSVWVNCANLSTSYQVAAALVNEMRSSRGGLLPEKDAISPTGHSQQAVFEKMYGDLEEVGGTVVIVLDEIDNIGSSDDILYGLPRARANGDLQETRPVVIGISNDFKFKDQLSPKVRDTLCEEKILFKPYDADELQNILNARAEKAFHDGVLDADVIPVCAAHAANDSGSARQAIRLLSLAGKIAVNNDEDVVTTDHVSEAEDQLNQSQAERGMEELTPQGHAVLLALASHAAAGETPVRTRDLYERYRRLTDELGTKQIVERRVRAHLSDMDMLGLAESNARNEGKRDGRYKEYELDVSLTAVLDVLSDEPRFAEAADGIRDRADENGVLQ